MSKTVREQRLDTWEKTIGNSLTAIQSLRLTDKAVPVVLLAVLFLAFGLTIISLGIYQDDWIFVYNAYARGPEGLWNFLNADGTPLSSLMNIALFYLLGFKPLYWHLAALLFRWLTAVVFWLLMRRLWPLRTLQNFFAALLFAIYPFFTLQPLAYTFLHVWVSYFLLGLSFYWMILSVQQPQRFWLYCILSLLAAVITEITLEYFMGLELLRPVLLWFALRDQEKTIRPRIIRIIKLWLPYLILFGIYVWWRFFIYEVPIENRNNPVGLELLFTDPLAEISLILSNIVPDILSILLATWYKVMDPLFFNLADRTSLLFILLTVIASVAVFLISRKQEVQQEENHQADLKWVYEALILGICIVVLGLIPPYVAGLFINEKNPLWNSRFGLASMPGAALILVAVLELISSRTATRILLLSILVGLAVGYHARYTNDFRWAWKKELNLYRQLVLRIPDLQPNTAIVADGEILYYMGDYPTAYAINTLYSQPLIEDGPLDYWYFGITTHFGANKGSFLNGMELEASHRSVSFSGRSDEIILVSFEPDPGECLHVIRPEDKAYRKLPPLLKEASHLSALDRIDTAADPSSAFLEAIGVRYPEDWCTYYQKADLARQMNDYEKVIQLWNQARERGFSPGAPFEYLLFIDAFVQHGRSDDAATLTLDAVRVFPILRPALCDYWNSAPQKPDDNGTLRQLESKLNCRFD